MSEVSKYTRLTFAEICAIIPIAAVSFPSVLIFGYLGPLNINYRHMFSLDDYILIMLQIWPAVIVVMGLYFLLSRGIKPKKKSTGSSPWREALWVYIVGTILLSLLSYFLYELPIWDSAVCGLVVVASIYFLLVYLRSTKVDDRNQILVLFLTCGIAAAAIFWVGRIAIYENILDPNDSKYAEICTEQSSCERYLIIYATKTGVFYIDQSKLVSYQFQNGVQFRWPLPDCLKSKG